VKAETTASFGAYRQIKDRIIDLSFPPGHRLSEARLAEAFDLGRSPIRTALARLEGEGWIEVSPQSGTFVRALSAREIDELTELRAILESHCIGVAATRISDVDIDRLRAGFANAGPQVRAGDAEAFIALDEELHGLVYRLGGNGLIAETLLGLRDKVQWIRRACAVSDTRIQEGFAEVEAIFEALSRRDPVAASARMKVHVENAARFCRMTDTSHRRAAGLRVRSHSAGA
jgi:DNA-binding GntR family transcriptional regulator